MPSIRIILNETIHPANIGAAARAMKTMAQDCLYLVKPRFFPSPSAYALASGGGAILEQAQVTTSLSEALADCQLILATAGRDSTLNFPSLELREAAIIARQYQSAGNQVGIVFGTESTGLSNAELKFCHYQVRIPTSAEFSSLNLAQAVQVVCYELLMAQNAAPQDPEGPPLLASHADTERMFLRLEELLHQSDFLKPGHDKIMMQKIRRLFQRAQLEVNEVKILQGIITSLC
jgi:tRNA (cytidine32/uridine32-2'-O)-methyltransferase